MARKTTTTTATIAITRTVLLIAAANTLLALAATTKPANGEHLATLFVLESADSGLFQPPASRHISSKHQTSEPVEPNVTENTRVITDDGEPFKLQQDINNNNDNKSNQQRSSTSNTSQKPQQQGYIEGPPQNQESSESANRNQKALPRSNQQQQSSRHSTQAPSQHQNNLKTTTTTATPKVEERLLISIVSHDDDEYQPVSSNSNQKQTNSGGNGGYSLEESYPSSSSNNKDPLATNSQQKRPKQSIVISIQDNQKQGGSGGSMPALVLRPSENGQSIVLSVGGANGKPVSVHEINSNSNHNDDSPTVATSGSRPNTGGQHHTQTTYRPSILQQQSSDSDSNTGGSSRRPFVSTLLDTSTSRPASSSSSSYDNEGTGLGRPINRPPISSSSLPSSSSYEDNQQPPMVYPTSSSNPQSSREPVQQQQQSQQQSKFPLNEKNCGVVHETRIVGGEEADADDHMWMVAIVKSRPKDGEARPFCGGSLITRRHILTAAHCLENLAPRDILVRIGSYDFDDTSSSSLSADYSVDQFRVPAEYSKKTHAADIAIMRLKTPLSTQDNYRAICMPQARRSYVGSLGTVIGYGSQSQTFRRQATKLRQVTVPVWENRKCSLVYKKPLNDSFLCAGYEEGGRDACQGDSGGPLMVEGPQTDQRMAIVGVVSHGIGCGGSYPGVYTRVSTYLEWIEKNTRE